MTSPLVHSPLKVVRAATFTMNLNEQKGDKGV